MQALRQIGDNQREERSPAFACVVARPATKANVLPYFPQQKSCIRAGLLLYFAVMGVIY